MPRGDRTGPFGQGPMSGRRAGFCGGARVSGYTGPGTGQGFGPGSGGRGRGWRHQFRATGMPGWARLSGASTQQDIGPVVGKDVLKNQAKELQQQMDSINARLEALESTEDEESK